MTPEREAAFRKLQDALATQAELAVFDPAWQSIQTLLISRLAS